MWLARSARFHTSGQTPFSSLHGSGMATFWAAAAMPNEKQSPVDLKGFAEYPKNLVAFVSFFCAMAEAQEDL